MFAFMDRQIFNLNIILQNFLNICECEKDWEPKDIIEDIREEVEDLLSRIESLELASDPELMESLKRSEEQIKNGDVVDFDDL